MISNKRKQDILKQKLAFSLNKDDEEKQPPQEKDQKYTCIFDKAR